MIRVPFLLTRMKASDLVLLRFKSSNCQTREDIWTLRNCSSPPAYSEVVSATINHTLLLLIPFYVAEGKALCRRYMQCASPPLRLSLVPFARYPVAEAQGGVWCTVGCDLVCQSEFLVSPSLRSCSLGGFRGRSGTFQSEVAVGGVESPGVVNVAEKVGHHSRRVQECA